MLFLIEVVIPGRIEFWCNDLFIESNIECDVITKMTARLCIASHEPKVYGPQYVWYASGCSVLYTMDNIEAVNDRRKRIGLGATMVPE